MEWAYGSNSLLLAAFSLALTPTTKAHANCVLYYACAYVGAGRPRLGLVEVFMALSVLSTRMQLDVLCKHDL